MENLLTRPEFRDINPIINNYTSNVNLTVEDLSGRFIIKFTYYIGFNSYIEQRMDISEIFLMTSDFENFKKNVDNKIYDVIRITGFENTELIYILLEFDGENLFSITRYRCQLIDENELEESEFMYSRLVLDYHANRDGINSLMKLIIDRYISYDY